MVRVRKWYFDLTRLEAYALQDFFERVQRSVRVHEVVFVENEGRLFAWTRDPKRMTAIDLKELAKVG